MAYMLAHDGRLLASPYEVTADDFDIDFIATGLSRIGRFVGRGARFLSVAEHSVTVSELVQREHAVIGLLHDATEAFVGDVHSHIKGMMIANNDDTYHYLERWFWELIADKYGMPMDLPFNVHLADITARNIEMDELFYERVPVRPCPPDDAKERFLSRACELGLA